MKRRIMTIALALMTAVTVAQFAITYRDRDDNLTATGPGGGATRYKVGGSYTLVLNGSASAKAQIASKAQGLSVRAANITAEIAPAKERQTRSRLTSAKATGGVEVVKDVVLNGAREITEMRSSSATYAAGSAEGRLDLNGDVTIRNVNEAKKQTSVVTGNNAVVMIDPDATGNNAVRTATLSGPVRVNVVEAPATANAAPRNFTATGDRLVYSTTAKPARITLTGNVKIVGTGQGDLDVQGADQAVLFLNEQGELSEVEMTGNPATTTYRKPGAKG